MAQDTVLTRLIRTYVALRQAPRHGRRTERLARQYAEARRQALKRCGAGAVVVALRSVAYV